MTVARVSAEQRWGTDVPPADAYAADAEGLAAELAARLQGEVRRREHAPRGRRDP